MQYLKLFFKCLGLFIIAIPLGYVILIIEGGVSINPTNDDRIVIIVSAFIGTIIAFIVGVFRIKRNNGETNDRKNIDQK